MQAEHRLDRRAAGPAGGVQQGAAGGDVFVGVRVRQSAAEVVAAPGARAVDDELAAPFPREPERVLLVATLAAGGAADVVPDHAAQRDHGVAAETARAITQVDVLAAVD